MDIKINENLRRERLKCEFNVEELTNYLDGGADYTRKRRYLENKIFQCEELFRGVPDIYMSHKEKYVNSIRKAVLYFTMKKEMEDSNQSEIEKIRSNFRSTISPAVFDDVSPIDLHFSMFIPAIKGNAHPDQLDIWLERANKMEIIGTYAQTELGHGTFIRGLETTATYDENKEEFVLHSPNITSYKWWPGGLGHTANYCITMAKLYVKGKSCGIQPFIVQLRDEETHRPLPGIKLGEIGVKLGFNTVNNGFLGFNDYRIPRERMLMRNAQVLKDGTFIQSANNKLIYGTMVYVRVLIVIGSANNLSRAVTIAMRYAAVQDSALEDELRNPRDQLLDKLVERQKLLIALTSTHALYHAAKHLLDMYFSVTQNIAAGNTGQLPELHALACCLKAKSSTQAAQLVEECRQVCGIHGLYMSSGLPRIYGLATASCTYEGENTVLMLQTARALVKAWHKVKKGGNTSPSMSYLMEKDTTKSWEYSIENMIANFRIIAARKVAVSVAAIENYIKKGLSPEDAWNMSAVRLVEASEAHSRLFILTAYKSELDKSIKTLSAPLVRVLYLLLELFFVHWTLETIGDFLLYTSISENDVRILQEQYERLLVLLRPNAVGLVDAFDFNDKVLHSALGAYDGRVYERLMTEALKSPLNAEPVNDSFRKYLKPLMQGKL